MMGDKDHSDVVDGLHHVDPYLVVSGLFLTGAELGLGIVECLVLARVVLSAIPSISPEERETIIATVFFSEETIH